MMISTNFCSVASLLLISCSLSHSEDKLKCSAEGKKCKNDFCLKRPGLGAKSYCPDKDHKNEKKLAKNEEEKEAIKRFMKKCKKIDEGELMVFNRPIEGGRKHEQWTCCKRTVCIINDSDFNTKKVWRYSSKSEEKYLVKERTDLSSVEDKVPEKKLLPTKVTSRKTLKPTTRITTKPTIRITTKPTTRVTTKPTTRITTKGTTRKTAKPTTRVTTKPTTRVTTKPTTRITTKPTTRVTTKPTTRVTTKPTTRITTKPTTRITTKPTTRITTKPTTRLTTKPTTRITKKPTTRKTPKGTTRQTTKGTTQKITKATSKKPIKSKNQRKIKNNASTPTEKATYLMGLALGIILLGIF